MKEQGAESGGTLMRGADGSLYYIPDSDLDAYRLSDEKEGQARRLLGDQPDLLSVSILTGKAAKRAGLAIADTTTVSIANVGAFRQGRG